MNFSLILPTRHRVELLTNLCTSIQRNTADPNNIEVLVACDSDDRDSCKLFESITYPWFKGYVRDRGSSISRDYQNWLYAKSSGKYIFILNDDVEIKTHKWDEIALSKIETYLYDKFDGIFYGWVADSENIRINQNRDAYSCFPILSRSAIDTLGYVMNEYYGGWSADVYLYNVYKEVNRILDLSEIMAKHFTHWLGIRERDETSASMAEKSQRTDILDHKPDSQKLLRKIQNSCLLL